jgi:hypothetical protein
MTNSETEDDELWSPPSGSTTAFFLLALAAVVAVFVAANFALRAAPPSSEVRIRNNTGSLLRQVVVNGQQYGNINAGQTGEYRKLRVAYRYASVRFVAGTREMQIRPEDYVGEVPLGRGKFTYVLTILDADRIDLSVEQDSQ